MRLHMSFNKTWSRFNIIIKEKHDPPLGSTRAGVPRQAHSRNRALKKS
jgi:hypothetical protein